MARNRKSKTSAPEVELLAELDTPQEGDFVRIKPTIKVWNRMIHHRDSRSIGFVRDVNRYGELEIEFDQSFEGSSWFEAVDLEPVDIGALSSDKPVDLPAPTPTLTIEPATLALMEARIASQTEQLAALQFKSAKQDMRVAELEAANAKLTADRDNWKHNADSYGETIEEIQAVVGRFEDHTLSSVKRLATEYNDLREALENIQRVGFEASFDNYTWEGFDEMRWTARKALGGKP